MLFIIYNFILKKHKGKKTDSEGKKHTENLLKIRSNYNI